jgi:hypothetical protein
MAEASTCVGLRLGPSDSGWVTTRLQAGHRAGQDPSLSSATASALARAA